MVGWRWRYSHAGHMCINCLISYPHILGLGFHRLQTITPTLSIITSVADQEIFDKYLLNGMFYRDDIETFLVLVIINTQGCGIKRSHTNILLLSQQR